jgi:hypothetical protein
MNGLGDQRLLLTAGKAGLAALAMGLITTVALPFLNTHIGMMGVVREFTLVLLSGGVSVAVYLLVAGILRIEELRWLGDLLMRRLNR